MGFELMFGSLKKKEGGLWLGDWSLYSLVYFGAIFLLMGCQTKAAKKAMNEPLITDSYTGFEPRKDPYKRKMNEKKREPVSDDLEPEKAVDILIGQLAGNDRYYRIPAEEELVYWGTKQGVAETITGKVRMLLKNPEIEVRAPALRLTLMYGKRESVGDLIEVLADADYGMRKSAFEALRRKTGRDFGFKASAGPLERAQALQHWRLWWQSEQQALASGKVPIKEVEQIPPPSVVDPKASPLGALPEITDAKGRKALSIDLPEEELPGPSRKK